jgi:hypothetical protein
MSVFTFPFPYFPVQFTKDGVLFQQPDLDALLHGIQTGVTDLFVMSHGWNNNMDDAQNLYSGLSAQLAAQIAAAARLKGRTFAICGVLWPSKAFDDADLIPGGAASLNDAVTDDGMRARVSSLADLIQARGWPMEAPDNAAQSKLDAVMQSVDDWADDPGCPQLRGHQHPRSPAAELRRCRGRLGPVLRPDAGIAAGESLAHPESAAKRAFRKLTRPRSIHIAGGSIERPRRRG